MKDADYWIKRLGLAEHPEGGYFVRTYRSQEEVEGQYLPKRFGGSRCFATAIYYLLKSGQPSVFHRLKSDELWHFYAGSALGLYVIDVDGRLDRVKLGPDYENGEVFQAVVRAGSWFAATADTPESYALVGCTVSPGFEFEDFELADRCVMLQQFPQYRAIIEQLT